MEEQEQSKGGIDEKLRAFMGGSSSATGIEDLYKEASKHTLQMQPSQIRLLLMINDVALRLQKIDERYGRKTNHAERLFDFVAKWREWHGNANSAPLIRDLVGYASLGKFVQMGLLQVSVQKK